jgi:ADP-heptose:LPS heptosyltransferase
MTRQNIILVGPCVGELYWEFFRFAPYVFNEQKKLNNIPLVVLTRKDRYDIYGSRCIEFKDLTINNENNTRFGECFRMIGLNENDYYAICHAFFHSMKEKYNIVKHLYPPYKKGDYVNKDYYPLQDRLFEYKVRKENRKLVKKFLSDVEKPIVILAPRYRKNFKRNWPHWQELYDKLSNTKWHNEIEFIICGKKNEYVPDKYNRFKDINNIELSDNASLFGVLLELMKHAKLTIGSQSAIPNISLLYKVPVVEWGNQKKLHTITYNIYKTPVKFFESKNFDISLTEVFNQIVIDLTNILLKRK